MEEQLFVRIRGHVQGPYELEKLRSLVRRGQLSRMHEVSSDGSVWKQASSFPELFTLSSVETAQVAPDAPSKGSSWDEIQLDEGSRPSSSGRWHYAQSGVQKGPVTTDELKVLFASGNLSVSELVWTDGMREWVPANTVAALFPPATHRTDGSNVTGLDKEVTRTLAESQPWSRFIATATMCVAAILLIMGATTVVMGARWSQAITMAYGGFSVLYGVVFLWGGQLLTRYCGDVHKLLRDVSIQRLDESLRSLRRFWIFLSIVLIVLLVNALAIAIWIFSIGVSLSGGRQDPAIRISLFSSESGITCSAFHPLSLSPQNCNSDMHCNVDQRQREIGQHACDLAALE